MNALKSYHALKSEQSKTFAASIKGEIIYGLKDLIRKETAEARKNLMNGKKNDLDMKLILEKIENVLKFI